MAEIRRATLADLDALLQLGQRLHAEAPEYRDEPFEDDVARAWLRQRMGGDTLLADGDSVVLLACVDGQIAGGIVALVVPRWFNRRRLAAELILYIRPESRGGRALPQLLRAFRAWAKDAGATKATIGVSTGIHAERTVHAYERLGFKLDGYTASTNL